MMTKKEVEQKLKKIVSDIFKVPLKDLKGSTRFAEDLKAKSLGMISLIAAVESEFGIKTTTIETSKNTTIKKAVDYIMKKLKEKQPKPVKKKSTKVKSKKKKAKK